MKTTNFADRLTSLIKQRKSCAVVGLDPHWSPIPESIKKSAIKQHGKTPVACAAVIRTFCTELIDAVCAHVPVVKPQSAFFEQFGPAGVEALYAVMEHARSKGLLVLLDVKRGDIGSTAQGYANAYLGESEIDGEKFEPFPADAVTVNPYLGSDSVLPFVETAAGHGKGVFVLVKTSNPSSAEIQDLVVENETVYMKVAQKLDAIARDHIGESGYSLLGAVAGGTFAQAGEKIRRCIPNCYILVPGYGAQGAGAADLKPFFNEDGLGAIINSSRAISFAYAGKPYAEKFGEAKWQAASEAAIIAMNEEIAAQTPFLNRKTDR